MAEVIQANKRHAQANAPPLVSSDAEGAGGPSLFPEICGPLNVCEDDCDLSWNETKLLGNAFLECPRRLPALPGRAGQEAMTVLKRGTVPKIGFMQGMCAILSLQGGVSRVGCICVLRNNVTGCEDGNRSPSAGR